MKVVFTWFLLFASSLDTSCMTRCWNEVSRCLAFNPSETLLTRVAKHFQEGQLGRVTQIPLSPGRPGKASGKPSIAFKIPQGQE
jgi:hypothetical protein